MIAWRRMYALNKAIAGLYDSMQVFAFDAAQVDVTYQGELHPDEFVQPKEPVQPPVVPPGPIIRAGVNIQPHFWHPYYMRRYPELRHARHLVDSARRYGFAPYSLLPTTSDHQSQGDANENQA